MDLKVEALFYKKFDFQRCDDFILPPVENIFKETFWEISSFLSLKERLNEVKSRLNDKAEAWHEHTKNINHAALIQNHIKRFLKPDLMTNAWCKFYEILATYPVVQIKQTFRSLHLCEAPGAFISALNYYLSCHYPKASANWKWFANTLNPYYEGHSNKLCVVDDRLIYFTLKNWFFGNDNTGDITSLSLLQEISQSLKSSGLVNLVTADGSVDCSENPGEQELIVSNLQFSEVLICLSTLSLGGNFVIKMFTCFESPTVCIVYLLNCVFNKVHAFKPVTSKPGNSEIYLVCLDFRGIDSLYLEIFQSRKDMKGVLLFLQSDIPESFLNQLEKLNNFFIEHQIVSIEENLQMFASMTHVLYQELDEFKDVCLTMFLRTYSLDPIRRKNYHPLFKHKKRLKSIYCVDSENRQVFSRKTMDISFETMKHRENFTKNELLEDIEETLNKYFPLKNKRTLPEVRQWIPVWKEMRTFLKWQDFKRGITLGKTIQSIKNSKFLNPGILTMFNEVISKGEISAKDHIFTSHIHWNWDELKELVNETPCLLSTCFCLHATINDSSSIITCGVLSILNHFDIRHFDNKNWNSTLPLCDEFIKRRKIIVIDPSTWGPPTFYEELAYRQEFLKITLSVLKILQLGDSLILHLQSLLTRFQVGLLFILISLFEEIIMLLPDKTSPALCGQLWILSNHIHAPSVPSIISFLEESILNASTDSNYSVLEIVSISNICAGQFYEYLLDINNYYVLQKLRRIITVEKIK